MSLTPPYNITRYSGPVYDDILDVAVLNLSINGEDITAQADLAEKLIYLLEGDNELPPSEKIEVQFVFNDWEDKYGKTHRRMHCFYTAAPYDDMELTSKPTHCIGWFWNPSEEKVETDTIPYASMPSNESLANASPVFSNPKESHAIANYDMERFEITCRQIVDITRATIDENHKKALFIAHDVWPNQSHEIFIEKNDKGETGVYYKGKHIMDLVGELERDLQSEFGHAYTNEIIGQYTMEDIQENPLEPDLAEEAGLKHFIDDEDYDGWLGPDFDLDTPMFLCFPLEVEATHLAYFLPPDWQADMFKEMATGKYAYGTYTFENDQGQAEASYAHLKLPAPQVVKAYIKDYKAGFPLDLSNNNKIKPKPTTPHLETYLGEASPIKPEVPVFPAQATRTRSIHRAFKAIQNILGKSYKSFAGV